MVGTVESTISLVGINPPGIVIFDGKGKKMKFITNASTVKQTKDGKDIFLRDFKKGDKVSIEYATNERGVNKALSIKIIE